MPYPDNPHPAPWRQAGIVMSGSPVTSPPSGGPRYERDIRPSTHAFQPFFWRIKVNLSFDQCQAAPVPGQIGRKALRRQPFRRHKPRHRIALAESEFQHGHPAGPQKS